MKKIISYLAVLLCSVSLFTACSDDDDTTWQKIPQTEISGSNATLVINGKESTLGSVQMTVNNEYEAVLKLKDVISGYSDVSVSVELEKQTDDSFKFVGTTELNTLPVVGKAENSVSVVTIEVSGVIYLDGKISVDIKATGVGMYAGTYSGDNLVLKYSDVVMVGKTVELAVVDGANISITLQNVIPGESQTVFVGVQPDASGNFSGEVTTSHDNIVKYSGSVTVATGILSLNLDVTMAHASEWAGTYALSEYTTDEKNFPVTGSLYSLWEGTDSSNTPKYLSGMFRYIGGSILPQALNTIILEKDGNICAGYVASPKIDFALTAGDALMMMMGRGYPTAETVTAKFATSGFVTSPKGLVTWNEQDGKFIVRLNVTAILTAAMGQEASGIGGIVEGILNGDASTVKQLLSGIINIDDVSDATINQLLGWVKNGIPMNYETTADGHTYLYLDKGEFDNILTPNADKKTDLKILWDVLSEAGLIPDEAKAAGTLITLIGSNWANTADFRLGLDLK